MTDLDIEPGIQCAHCGAGMRMANIHWADCINPYCLKADGTFK